MNAQTDALTSALHTYFAARLGDPAGAAQQGISLNFDPFPSTLSPSTFGEPAQGGRFSVPRATEYCSRYIADRAAYLVNGARFTSLEPISEIMEFNVVNRATFYPRFDHTAAANNAAELAFNRLIERARAQLAARVASVSGQPDDYLPSVIAPANWLDPQASDGWAQFKQTLSGQGPSAAAPAASGGMRLPWRQIDLAAFRDYRRKLPPPGDPMPPDVLDINEVKLRPPWMTPPRASSSNLDRDRLRLISTPGGLGGPLGGHGTTPLAMAEAAGAIPFKLDDFAAFGDDDDDSALQNLLKAAVLPKVTQAAPGTTKNSVEVSFDHQIVQINRSWLPWGLIQNSDWYIPGSGKAAVSGSSAGQPAAMLQLIPDRFIAVRNVTIKADFTGEDGNALGSSFAIGPFRLDKSAAIVAGELRIPGAQIIAYVDRGLPAIPPRSDPSFPF
jgi:hypothetical protein